MAARSRQAPLTVAVALVLALLVQGWRASSLRGGPATQPEPAAAPVRLRATAFEVRTAALVALDARELGRAATAGQFQKTLEAIGPTRALYLVD